MRRTTINRGPATSIDRPRRLQRTMRQDSGGVRKNKKAKKLSLTSAADEVQRLRHIRTPCDGESEVLK